MGIGDKGDDAGLKRDGAPICTLKQRCVCEYARVGGRHL